MSQAVATIRPYEAPFYEERVWDLAGFEDWERELLTAVRLGAVHALEDQLAALEAPDADGEPSELGEAYGKSRAFALDYWGPLIYHGLEPQEGGLMAVRETGAFREWRKWRAATFRRFTPVQTQQMLAVLAEEEEAALEDLRWAYLADDAAVAAPMEAYGIRLDKAE